MLVGRFARPRKPGSSGVEAWTSSSAIPVQAYRNDMLAEVLAVTSGVGGGAGRGLEQILSVVDVPVILQVEFQQSKMYV